MTDRSVVGILNIDKPYGLTSMEVVRRVRRSSGTKRVGHGGTLDPIATGVVPVALGQATRVLEYLLNGSKAYTAQIELGVSTNTYDAMGDVIVERDVSGLSLAQIESAMTEFRGEIAQVPPMFSALKQQGRRLYDLARSGVEVEREARDVVVYDIELTGWDAPVATVDLVCGKGFYVRSLAHDLGEALGCGGHMKSLVRRRTGPFHIDNSISLDEAQRGLEADDAAELLYPPDFVLGDLLALILGPENAVLLRNGRPLPPAVGEGSGGPDGRARAYSVDGTFIAITRFDADLGQWRPEKVFDRGQ